MAKILLVEDDNNLREIYEARLQAEGYTIVSAKDGEEALVMAKAEKPDLVISDVMMPRVSGFEMLDILRNTEGFKDTKVIMLTALGQAEDQARADKLGADRYLVKSQVTLEDIVHAADELLGGIGATAQSAPAAAAAAVPATPAPQPQPAVPVVAPSAPTVPTAAPVTAPAPTTPVVTPQAPVTQPVTPPTPPAPAAPVAPAAMPAPSAPSQPVVPTSEPAAAPVAQPVQPAPTPTPPTTPAAPTTNSSDDQLMADAMRDLLSATPAAPEPAAAPVAAPTTPNATSPTPPAAPTVTTPEPVPDIPVAPAPPVEPPAVPAALEPTATPAPSVPPMPVAAEAPAPTPAVQPDNTQETQEELHPDDSSPIAHKKVIAPIPSTDAEVAKPDLNTLLAKEGITDLEESNDSADRVTAPHPPGHVISPTAAPTSTTPGNAGVDPSSIAL